MSSILAIFAASAALAYGAPADPSLQPSAFCGTAVAVAPAGSQMRASSTGLLLSGNGIVMYWFSSTSTLVMSLDGSSVTDLTYSLSGTLLTFAGLFSNNVPALVGTVSNPSGSTWTINIERPNHKPERYTAVADGEYAVVTSAQACDCDDNIGLTCKSIDCDNDNSCSAGTATCKWKTIKVE
jgi:hypothetical protein